MIITLIDADGISFDLNTLLIEEIIGRGFRTELVLTTGEHLFCSESSTKIMKKIIDAEFGGNGNV